MYSEQQALDHQDACLFYAHALCQSIATLSQVDISN
jgi:hypothetical protein